MKKLLLTLETLSAAIVPIAAVVSCGDTIKKESPSYHASAATVTKGKLTVNVIHPSSTEPGYAIIGDRAAISYLIFIHRKVEGITNKTDATLVIKGQASLDIKFKSDFTLAKTASELLGSIDSIKSN